MTGQTGADTGQSGADTGQTRGRHGADRGRHGAEFLVYERDTEFLVEDLQPLPSLVPWWRRSQCTGTWKAIDMKMLRFGSVPCWWLKESQNLTCLEWWMASHATTEKKMPRSRQRRSSVFHAVRSKNIKSVIRLREYYIIYIYIPRKTSKQNQSTTMLRELNTIPKQPTQKKYHSTMAPKICVKNTFISWKKQKCLIIW